jgi:hypothetical protein
MASERLNLHVANASHDALVETIRLDIVPAQPGGWFLRDATTQSLTRHASAMGAMAAGRRRIRQQTGCGAVIFLWHDGMCEKVYDSTEGDPE